MMEKQYTTDDFIRVAKRENNTKRAFLYVNPLQGKHIPVSPAAALSVFAQLGGLVNRTYPDEKLLIIGFSETATAVGAALAVSCPNAAAFLTTTRENVADTAYLYFSESHSHATEQRLAVRGLEAFLRRTDRVIFAEDEVTTGNTILKLIASMRNAFPEIPLQFGIASLLNSMTAEKQRYFAEQGIGLMYLSGIPNAYRTDEINKYNYEPLMTAPKQPHAIAVSRMQFASDWNQRLAADTQQIREICGRFVQTADALPVQTGERILVLGTEEFMYAGLIFGETLEKKGCTVRFHAATRSPIEVSLSEEYPLHKRYPLVSFYDSERRTFIYNLAQYDRVFIVTDAPQLCEAGLDSLTGALEDSGNQNVTVIEWGAKA